MDHPTLTLYLGLIALTLLSFALLTLDQAIRRRDASDRAELAALPEIMATLGDPVNEPFAHAETASSENGPTTRSEAQQAGW